MEMIHKWVLTVAAIVFVLYVTTNVLMYMFNLTTAVNSLLQWRSVITQSQPINKEGP